MFADWRWRAVGIIGAGQVWPIALAWVDGIAAGLEKNSPGMPDMIDRPLQRKLVIASRLVHNRYHGYAPMGLPQLRRSMWVREFYDAKIAKGESTPAPCWRDPGGAIGVTKGLPGPLLRGADPTPQAALLSAVERLRWLSVVPAYFVRVGVWCEHAPAFARRKTGNRTA